MRMPCRPPAGTILVALSFVTVATAWGRVGHRTIALLSALYLTDEELSILNSIIAPTELSDAAIWADEIAQIPGLEYTNAWHYINVKDSPPADCNVRLGRDHNDTSPDILTAFANHTTIFTDMSAAATDRSDAMKFLLHWIGDVHQPLHVEGLARGGVDIPVFFANESTNLHAVWDFHIIEKYRGVGNEVQIAKAWAEEIFGSDTDPELTVKRQCHNLSTPLDCILMWAREANQVVCDTVLKEGLDRIYGTELSARYYQDSRPVVEHLVRAAGQRLAAWIKALIAVLAEHPLYQADQSDQVYYHSVTDDILRYHEEM